MTPYVEHGGSWRVFWLVAGALPLLFGLDVLLPAADVPPLVWALALLAVLGVVAAGTASARRAWTVRVDGRGDDAALTVGRERVPLTDVDTERLRVGAGGAGAGAPVLGGGGSLPKGRTGLPLRLTDGRTVLVPTRDPAALRAALVDARGTLGS